MEDNTYEVAIIGGGPAGLTAALYCNRDNIKTILFEPMLMGGMVNEATLIENYPGYPNGINGYELSAQLFEQADKFGMKAEYAEVTSITKSNDLFKLETSNGQFQAKAVIIATGSNKMKLNVPGEQSLTGKGVSYCATCDAPFFRNKVVAVIGGGNTALMEAEHLSQFASKVYLIHRRDAFRATSIVNEKVSNISNIEKVLNQIVIGIEGSNQVEKIILENTLSGEKSELAIDGVFVAIGIKPNTEMLKDLLLTEPDGTIKTNTLMETTIPGLFAAGDVRYQSIRQVISACGDGATSAISAKNYIRNN